MLQKNNAMTNYIGTTNYVGTYLSFLLVWFSVVSSGHTQDTSGSKKATLKAKPVMLKEIGEIDPALDSISKGQNDTINTILNNVDQTTAVAQSSGAQIGKVEKKMGGLNKDLYDLYTIINPKKFSPAAISFAPIPPIVYVRPIPTKEPPKREVTPDVIKKKSRFWLKVKRIFR